MEELKFKPIHFKGSFTIKAKFSLKETSELINKHLDLNLVEDLSGYYEEFPGFSNSTLNIQMALLGIPQLEFRMDGYNYDYYNFSIIDNNKYEKAESINLGTNFVSILNANTELSCQEEWIKGQVIDDCINIEN